MPIDAELLEILACPACRTPVRLVKDGTALKCDTCHRVYAIKDDEKRVVMNLERVNHWLSEGAQPTDRVARFLEAAGVRPKAARANLKSGTPGKAMAERAAKKAARSAEPAAEAVAE